MNTLSAAYQMARQNLLAAPAAFMLSFLMVAVLAPLGLSTAASAQDGPAFQQIQLTDAHVKGYLKVADKLPDVFERLDKAEGKPGKKLQSEIKSLGRSGGFKSLAELEDVVATITFVMSGMDEDGNFQEPSELLKAELKEIEADTEMKAKEKEEMTASIKESIEGTPKLKHAGNVDVIKANLQALLALSPPEEPPKN